MSKHSIDQLQQHMMELYEQEDFLSIIACARNVDRYHLSDAQLIMLAASYYYLGRNDNELLKAGIAFLLPLEHPSLRAYSQWHFYLGMSLHNICNYARAFQHFHEFLALNSANQDQQSKERQSIVEQKIRGCQAFLTLPFFNQTFADRVKQFWLSFDSLVPIISLYVDKLNHVKQEQRPTRTRSLHGSQKKCAEALTQIKMLIGSLFPGQNFSVRFLTKEQNPARFEIIFPIGRFITRMHALKYLVSQAPEYSINTEHFICTIGTPIHYDYDSHMGDYHATANDVNAFIRVDDKGQWHDDISRQLILYSAKLSDCPDALRAQILTNLLYHNSGELAIHTFFDDISVIDDHDNEQMQCLIAQDKLFNKEIIEQTIKDYEEQEKELEQEQELELEEQSRSQSQGHSKGSSQKNETLCASSKLDSALKSKQRTHAYAIDEHDSRSIDDTATDKGPSFCQGNTSRLVVKDDNHYLQIPLSKLNLYLKIQGLAVDHVHFDEYWLTNSLDIFSDHLFASAPGSNEEIDDELDEAMAIRLESFWTLTSCYELEDYMTDLDQSTSIACYDWGIMPCFLIIPLSNFNVPDSCFNANGTIVADHLPMIKDLVIKYKDSLVKRLLQHCKTKSFSCTGLALSHEFLFIDFMLWQPFCVIDGIHDIITNDGFVDVGIKSFHPFTNEMAVDQLDYTLAQAKP